MKTWIISVAVLVAIRLVPVLSSFERAGRSKRETRFNLALGFRIAEAAGFGILLGSLITPLLVGDWRSGWWQILLAAIGTLLTAEFLPGPIVLDDFGISERRLLRSRRILWPDVESVIQDLKRRAVIVTGKDGTETIHTDIHVSSNEFARELRKMRLEIFQEQ